MKFILKTDIVPSVITTNDWFAGEDRRTGRPFLTVLKKTYRLKPESFELIYYMSQKNLLNDNMVVVLDRGHIDIWRM